MLEEICRWVLVSLVVIGNFRLFLADAQTFQRTGKVPVVDIIASLIVVGIFATLLIGGNCLPALLRG